METILIAGGTGLIGIHLANYLDKRGYNIRILSREKKHSNFPIYTWSISEEFIDKKALVNVDYIINLAGANIGTKPWTKKRQKQIINSRIDGSKLLFDKINQLNIPLKGYVGASAIGYYGSITKKKIFIETDEPTSDFLGNLCFKWEKEAEKFSSKSIRTILIRTGVVLTPKGGALEKMIKPINLGFGAVLGNGKQYIPWIHIEDLCRMYEFAIKKNNLIGVYNAVSPNPVTNKEFTQKLAQQLAKKLWLPPIPVFVLKLILGKMSSLVLYGSRISSNKIKKTGFSFNYPKLEKALTNLGV